MIAQRIAGATRTLGEDQGYQPLAIRDGQICFEQFDSSVPTMTAAFEPTPAELERLNAGGTVYLTIIGAEWPPCRIEVGEKPAEWADGSGLDNV